MCVRQVGVCIKPRYSMRIVDSERRRIDGTFVPAGMRPDTISSRK